LPRLVPSGMSGEPAAAVERICGPGDIFRASPRTVLANTTGLVAGVIMPGDELSLLYRQDQIAASAFAAMLEWTERRHVRALARTG
jgi:hypothetical protein